MQHSRLVFCLFLVALMFTVSPWTAAQDSSATSADAALERISSYLDKSTVFVGYFDPKNVDLEKSVASLREIIDGSLQQSNMPAEMKGMIQPMFAQGFDALEKELKEGRQGGVGWQHYQDHGCDAVYMLVNSMTMAQSPARFLYAFDPSVETAKIDSLQTILQANTPFVRFQHKDGLIVGDFFQPGLTDELRQAAENALAAFDKSRKPTTRPELLAGMERTKSAPFKLVFAPDTALKGMIQMFYPMAPPEIQEALPAKTILAGAHWISLGIDINRWIIDLNIKGESPEAAQALYDAVIKFKDDSLAPMADQAKALDEQIMPFIPKVQEDRLRLTINRKFLDDHLPSIIQYALPAIMAAQSGAQFLPAP